MKLIPVLVIIYNHRFPENIEKLEYIYKHRFSKRFHLIPHYKPQKHEKNVVPVHYSSDYFHGQISEGLSQYRQTNATHYIFCADDLLLNPEINENNFSDYFQLDNSRGYTGEFVSISPSIINIPQTRLPIISKPYGIKLEIWANGNYAYSFNHLKYKGKERLPDPKRILYYFKTYGIKFNFDKHGLHCPRLILLLSICISKYFDIVSKYFVIYLLHLPLIWILKQFLIGCSFKTRYPLAAGFSDIFIVPQSNINTFAHYANYFAEAKLFVEIAIPMCFALSNTPANTPHSRLKQYKQRQYVQAKFNQYKIYEHPGWYGQFPIPQKECTTIDSILRNWPKEYLYIHYFKLSKINYR